ncbi:uncharacterized protein MELLADRAFT_101441 [Melampsora larici-populina 98AG31]|uniref:Uncharacterized protein n=1 Tax=Melampsora larici-populina (strain 98AG31 / pathotype 3-4-7) TaxID=747676 RepID=F4R4R5_MELLP|nr:uncharacterized protein MELLADRAFT_101441 [Melampsora larici-populina 98AG31]EGG12855.1 hypothetical protein MELLADRAFT_101441 [Melampsora larici-populina 98AG31]
MASKPKAPRRESRFLSTLAKFLYMMIIFCLPCQAAKSRLEKRMSPGPRRLPIHLEKRMTQVDHITQPLLHNDLVGQHDRAQFPEHYATAKKAAQTGIEKHDPHKIKSDLVAWHAPETYRYKTQSGNPTTGSRMSPTDAQSVSVDEVRSEQRRYLPEWLADNPKDLEAFRDWLAKRFSRKFKQSELRKFTNARDQEDYDKIDVYMTSARKKWMYKRPQNPYGPPQSPYKDPHYYFNKWWNIRNRRIECYGNYWKLFKVGLGEALTAARKNIKYLFRRLEWFLRKGK